AGPMPAALAAARVPIDAPLVVLGRTAKSWGSNLSLANPGKERIATFLADVEQEYRHAPLRNFTTANMWAEGILTAKKLLPRELGTYEFDEAAYLRMTARELEHRSALGVDVSREIEELARYLDANHTLLGVTLPLPGGNRTRLWQQLRSTIANAGARSLRRRVHATRNAWKVMHGSARSGFNVAGASFGFNNVFEASEFLARIA